MRKLVAQQWVTADTIAAEEDGGLSFVAGEPFDDAVTDNPFQNNLMGFHQLRQPRGTDALRHPEVGGASSWPPQRTSTAPPTRSGTWVAEHTRTYLTSGGTEGHFNDGVRTLVLATTGRRTGTPRRTCLIYGTCGEEYVVVASKGGADQDPAWFGNLVADPAVGVQVGTRRFSARPGRVPGRARVAVAGGGGHLPALRRVRGAVGRMNDPRRRPLTGAQREPGGSRS